MQKSSRKTGYIILAVLFLFMGVGSAIKVLDKVQDGKTAFVRWMADTEKLVQGEMVYSTALEQYPHLPMTALLLVPFHAMGAVPGSLCWLFFKCLAIAVILWAVADAATVSGRSFPPWALVVLFILSIRVFVGDLTHGNLNVVVGGLIAGSLMLSARNRDFSAGTLLGLAAILKVTPALFLLYFLYKRRWAGLLGMAFAGLLFGWLIPGLFLGFQFNYELTVMWVKQMIEPFLAGKAVWWMQTRYENQSLTGLLYRLLTDSVAIPESAAEGHGELRIHFLSLAQPTVARLLKGLFALILALLAWVARTPRYDRKSMGNLGEYALVFLAMLLISERSWKHHYILLMFAHGFLLHYLITLKSLTWHRFVVWGCFMGAILCHLGFSETTMGDYRSNVFEAYGIYLLGGIFLFVGTCFVLRFLRPPRGAASSRTCHSSQTAVASGS